MQNTIFVETDVGGKTIKLEAGLLAQQAHGAVTAQLGDTILFSAVTTTSPREGIDFFPLQVEYREKFYAAGRFPGGFFKREARPSEKEILTARLTDRPIRPLFHEGYRDEVQINNMLLSADAENDSDVLSITAASAALTISELPFLGPIGAVRVGRVEGSFIINPTNTEREQSDFDLIYAATREYPIMIEGGGAEIKEEDMIAGMKFAHAECVKLIDAQLELRKKLGLSDKVVPEYNPDTTLLDAAREIAAPKFAEALDIPGKQDRASAAREVKESLNAALLEKFPELTKEQFRSTYDQFKIEILRKRLLEENKRVDGRDFDSIRPLQAQLGLLPRAHGSALFSRGETQTLGSVTLGTKSDSQSMDAVTGGPSEKEFMLHYNFPPYSVGEVGRLGGTNRREIGHGALAERSLLPVIPKDYPYTVRLVADVMGSNGSSSMASVCAGTLALMDAGIPITKPVAGISIGMFSDEKREQIVVDIVGEEDHCGDMDFKVAGTRDGITGFQVDLKMGGLKWELVEEAFRKARDARLQILDFMKSIIAESRPEMSKYAPRIEVLKINPEKIGALIGPGGKNIRRITELTGTQIDIEDDGSVSIFGINKEAMDMAIREVNMVSAEPEEGVIYEGPVTGIKEFGAFVEVLPGIDGLVHISELADFRVKSVEDVCKVGDMMTVKCVGIDDRGRVKLSRKQAMAEKDEKN